MLRSAWDAGSSEARVLRALTVVVGDALDFMTRVGINVDPRLRTALAVAARWAAGAAPPRELAAAYAMAYRAHMEASRQRTGSSSPPDLDWWASARAAAAVFAVLAMAHDPQDLVALGTYRTDVTPLLARHGLSTLVGGYHEDALTAESGTVAAAAASAALNARDVRIELGVDESIATRMVATILQRALD